MIGIRVCRESAEQCRTMAKSAGNETQKALFLRLAEQWDTLAKSREKFLRVCPETSYRIAKFSQHEAD